jgi:alkylhydroperoxidase family enzyme
VSALLAISVVVVVAVLAVVGFGPSLAAAARRRRRPRSTEPEVPRYDPGRERRAERRARELLRSVISAEEYEMYVELGFLSVPGADARYAYLVYPHRPILAYDTATDELLSEYCVAFPDRSESLAGERLPDADDVLAKWMSLRGSERELIAAANMHAPGRQVDPGNARRDLRRLREWRRLRTRMRRAA